ncbi:MAG: chorismate mutase [bacterium]
MIHKPAECKTMEDVRVEIDRLDQDLIKLLAERWQYVDRAWQLKNTPEEATVPWRIKQVIEQVRQLAEQHNLPPSLAEALWRQIIGWGIQYEEERLADQEKL